jgi:hypothetical protein
VFDLKTGKKDFFYKKIYWATKTPRHKGKSFAFFILRVFVPWWQTVFRSEAEKIYSSYKELKIFLNTSGENF